jgi:hypothetical protein
MPHLAAYALGLEWIQSSGIQVYVKRKMARTRGFGAPSPARRGWSRQIPPPVRVDDARRTTLLGLSSPLWSTCRGRPLAKGRRSRLRPRRGGFCKKNQYVDGVSTTVVRALRAVPMDQITVDHCSFYSIWISYQETIFTQCKIF